MKIYKILFPVTLTLFLGFSSCGNGGKEKPLTDSVAPKDSIGIVNEMIRKDPGNLDLYLKRSRLYMRNKDFEASLADMNRILAVDSSKPEYLIAAADINLFTGRVTRTKQLLERAVAVNPGNVDCMLRLATLYHYLTKYDDEMKYLDIVLHKDVHNSQAYFMKGMLFKELHDTTKAISSMQTAVEQDPDYYNAYIQLGLLCAAKKLPVAEDYYKDALNINPGSEEALYDLGMYYQEIKNWNAAIETYTTLLKVNPHHFDAHFNLGIIHTKELNVTDEGMKYFNLAVEDDPKNPRGYYGRGYCFEKKGDITNAVADYRMALTVDSTYTNAAIALSKLKQ